VKEVKPSDLEIKIPKSIFNLMDDLKILEDAKFIGQDKAIDSMNFGLAIREKGYNVFVVGPNGTGRRTSAKKLAQMMALKMPTPNDQVYVYNFENPMEPNLISLSPGKGKELKNAMENLVEEVQDALMKAFESEDYSRSKSEIEDEFTRKKRELWENLVAQSKELGFLVQVTPTGVATIPLYNDKPITPEVFEELSEQTKKDIEERGMQVRHLVEMTLQKSRQMDREMKRKLEELDKYVALFAVGGIFEDMSKKFKDNPEVLKYLEDVKKDMLDNIKKILDEEKRESILSKYKVNLFVDNSGLKGAPVIEEVNPTYPNLFGKVEYVAKMGMLYTDYTLIRPGSLHKANGGFLILDALDVLKFPYVWDTLKKVLMSGYSKIENIEGKAGIASTLAPKPEPIPVDLKVILVGDHSIYDLLYHYDPDFKKLFKIKSEFDWEMPLDEKGVKNYLTFISKKVKENSLPKFTKKACEEIVKYGSRLADSKNKLSANFNKILSLIVESAHIAKMNNKEVVDADDVKNAIRKSEERVNLLQQKYDEMIAKGEIMVMVKGKKVGQINGLSVTNLGDHSFGIPVKITAKTYLGKVGVVDIHREADLSGKIHGKAVLTLEGFLGWKYAQKVPLSLSASISFEQVYSYLEGDSASLAETLALISALSKVPIDQGIAVTGSINQHGEVQPVGGVKEKIEGFYRACKSRGLTGEQGVIIPEKNLENLVLNDEVKEAVRKGVFKIWTVKDVDEAIEIVMGKKAGERKKDGSYPRNTVNYLVCKALEDAKKKLEGESKKKTKKKTKGKR